MDKGEDIDLDKGRLQGVGKEAAVEKVEVEGWMSVIRRELGQLVREVDTLLRESSRWRGGAVEQQQGEEGLMVEAVGEGVVV